MNNGPSMVKAFRVLIEREKRDAVTGLPLVGKSYEPVSLHSQEHMARYMAASLRETITVVGGMKVSGGEVTRIVVEPVLIDSASYKILWAPVVGSLLIS